MCVIVKNLTHNEGAPLTEIQKHTHILNELPCSFNELTHITEPVTHSSNNR